MPADAHRALIHTWADLPVDHPTAKIDRRRVVGSRMMVSHVVLHRGFRVASHRHPQEQFALVLSGRVRFGLGEPGTAD